MVYTLRLIHSSMISLVQKESWLSDRSILSRLEFPWDTWKGRINARIIIISEGKV